MDAPPIPERIPPLAWRAPALAWTPLALALALGGPALLFFGHPGAQRLLAAAAAASFGLALAALSLSWAIGRPPRSRRIVLLHSVYSALVVLLAAPFLLTAALSTATGQRFGLATPVLLAPLALMLGLPAALAAGLAFAWLALAPQQTRHPRIRVVVRDDVQPFI